MKKIALFLLIYSFLPAKIQAQLTGTITDSKGNPLPFANVYVENTTQGTTANTEGVYSFDLKNGAYRIVFQYIGYKKKIESVKIEGKTTLDVQLQSSDFELSEFVVKANAEDPAYPIMRKAIENRKFYRDQVKSYSSDVYIKGVQKIFDAPKKLFGRELGDMGGSLDTNTRSGILYLSETISKLYVDGEKKKEVLVSAKVSGNDNGFGFNRATLFDFNFYDNFITIQRQILSPIGESAMQYYRYHLVGTIKDQQGNNVYKIEVLPKRAEDPTWAGIIYIVDNQYNIYSTDLYVTGKSIQVSIMDTLWLRQSFVPVDKVWRMFSQNLAYKLNIFGLKIKGDFTGVYSNFNLTPQYEKGFFTNEIFKAFKDKSDKDLAKWDTIRPIPLTIEERKDYIKKDSIQTIRQTKPYLDSVSHARSKFNFLSLLTGYNYTDLWNQRNLLVTSPLSTFDFNPVQGLSVAMNVIYSQRFGERFEPYKRMLTVTPSVSYSFAEDRLRASANVSYLFNRFNYRRFFVEGGQKVMQFNDQNPISTMTAQLYSLYGKENYYKIYDKTFFKVGIEQDIANGLTANVSFEYAERNSLDVNSNFSFVKKDVPYDANTPAHVTLPTRKWANHPAYLAELNLTWIPAQKYLTYPNFKRKEEGEYPTFSFRLQKTLPVEKGRGVVDYTKIRLRVEQERIGVGLAGFSELGVEFGGYLHEKNVQFIDFQHFNGNQTILANPRNYMNSFFQLPYYTYSTRKDYFMAHWQHHFESYFFDKIPLIRKLGFKEVLRVSYLHTVELGHYVETGLGIDNIGWGIFRFFRFDVSWKYQDGAFDPKPGVMIGVKL